MATIISTLRKDVDETRTFTMNWSAHLEILKIATSTWSITPSMNIVAQYIYTGNTKTAITVAGGTANTTYVLTNTITVTNGDVYQRSGAITVVD